MAKPQAGKTQRWLVALLAFLLPVLVCALLLFINGYSQSLYVFIRGAALLAYLYAFEAILASGLVRHLVKLYRKPFVKIHHMMAVTALALMLLHGGLYAFYDGSWAVLLPRFDSWAAFLETAGRPALLLFLLASGAALYRQVLKNAWKLVHVLTFLAFALATVHGILIGSDTFSSAVRVLMWLLLVVVFGVAGSRRVGKTRS